jgi:hypothetical protein
MIFRSVLPAALNLVDSAQSNSVLESSETVEAVAASAPPIVPGFGAASAIVKTRGSGIGGAPTAGRDGVKLEFLGNKR